VEPFGDGGPPHETAYSFAWHLFTQGVIVQLWQLSSFVTQSQPPAVGDSQNKAALPTAHAPAPPSSTPAACPHIEELVFAPLEQLKDATNPSSNAN
jgi:hypothetical protein